MQDRTEFFNLGEMYLVQEWQAVQHTLRKRLLKHCLGLLGYRALQVDSRLLKRRILKLPLVSDTGKDIAHSFSGLLEEDL